MLEKISSDLYMPKYEQLKQILRQKIKNRGQESG